MVQWTPSVLVWRHQPKKSARVPGRDAWADTSAASAPPGSCVIPKPPMNPPPSHLLEGARTTFSLPGTLDVTSLVQVVQSTVAATPIRAPRAVSRPMYQTPFDPSTSGSE